MTDQGDVNVVYRVKADFRSLIKSTLEARAAMQALNSETEAVNKNSVAGSAATTAARLREQRVTAATTDATKSGTTASKIGEAATAAATRAVERHTGAQGRSARAMRDASVASRALGRDTEAAASATDRAARSLGQWIRDLVQAKADGTAFGGSLDRISGGLSKISNWRPALTPPWVALIPLLAAALALINPLIAGLGALSSVAIGLASSLGTLAGAAVGLVPALSGALVIALALKTALSGVGGAISAGITATTSSSAGSSTATKQDPYAISSTEKITRAQEAYKNSIQDVKFAEQSLFDARRQYTRQVQDLTEAVNQYTDATRAADAASVESAQQNYDNVLASSSSTKADKDAALAAIKQAKDQAQQDALQHQRDVQDLGELKRGGINNNQSVVQAQRGVTDARNSRRDARIAVKNSKYDAAHPVSTGTAAGAAATEPYAEALGQLSPAAQKFVQWVLSMKDAWRRLQLAVQESFFDKFVGDLDRLRGLLPPVQSMLTSIAGALGKVADGILRQVTGGDWKHDIVFFGQLLAPIITTAGRGLGALLQAFKDLTLAATPFLGKVVGSLTKGADAFAAFIANGRKTGSIKSALDTVFDVMGKWWTVIKNISATLYNYGKAAAPFGQWLTDGIVRITGAWKTASETATKANSPFKQWLENVKPLLTEMSRDLGAFFGWIGKVASNKDNIGSIRDLLKALRTKIGPGIADILQQLVKAKVPKAVTNLVVKLVGLIDTLVRNGGAKGIANFFDALSWIIGVLTDAASSPIGRWLTNTFLPLLGTLSAFLLPVGPVTLLLRLLGFIANFKPGPLLGKVGSWLGEIASSVGEFVGPAFAGAASVIGDILGVLAVPIVLPKINVPGMQKNAPFALTPSIDWKSAAKDATAGLTLWATGLPGLLSKASGDAFRDVKGPGHWLGVQWATFSKWANRLASGIARAAGSLWRNLISVIGWLGQQWAKISSWASGLARRVASAAGSIWHSITGIGGWLGQQWSTISHWASGIPARIGKALAGMWSLLPNLKTFLGKQLRGLGTIGTAAANLLGLPGGGGSKGGGSWSGSGGSFGSGGSGAKYASTVSQALRMAGAPQSWANGIETIISHESGGNPTIQNTTDINARNGIPSTGLMQLIPPNFDHYAGSLRGRGITDPLANIFAGIRYIQSRYGSPSNTPGLKALAAGQAYSYYASGGRVHGTGDGDTVPAMLTPGEFILPKALVQKIGVENLDALRSGAQSFAQIMAGLQQPAHAHYRPQLATMGYQSTPTLTKPHTAKSGSLSPLVAGNLVINQVKPIDVQEALPRAIRKVAYLHKGR